MKKFLLTLAAVAFASSVLMAQTPANNTTQEEPDRIANRHLSKNPTGTDIPTGYDRPQVVKDSPKELKEVAPFEKKAAPKHECKDHKDGQPCTKPADQQCDDCKAKAAAAPKHECKEGMKDCKKGEGPKHECKEGMKDCKKGEGPKHECKEGKHECKEGAPKQCDKGAIKKMHEECKDHKDGQPCTKPADQQCPDCKEKAKKN